MSKFLVTFDTTMDNVPVALCDTMEEAEEIAAQLPVNMTTEMIELMNASAESCCVSVFTFDEYGKAVSRDVVRNFDDEDDDSEG